MTLLFASLHPDFRTIPTFVSFRHLGQFAALFGAISKPLNM
jgi:hypothetical protein